MAIKYGLTEWRDYHPRDDGNAPIVLCFGDSWFQYPIPGIGNLPGRLLDFSKHQSFDIVALGENGMEIGKPGKNNLYDLTTFFQWETRTMDMIVLSGGGNDFAGADDLDPLLKVGTQGAIDTWFKKKETSALFQTVEDGYRRVIYLRDTFCPGIPIVTHCYDYAQASGKGLLWLSPWIKPSLDKIGLPPARHGEAVQFLIDQLGDVQTKLAGPAYHFIDTRNCLGKKDWSNELHPTGAGFNKIARMFYPVFEIYFKDWMRKPRWF